MEQLGICVEPPCSTKMCLPIADAVSLSEGSTLPSDWAYLVLERLINGAP